MLSLAILEVFEMEKLNVPENITLRWELWRGVGKKELAAIAAVALLSCIVAIIYCTVSTAQNDTLIAMSGVIFMVACAVGFFAKTENNQSVYDYLCTYRRYHSTQQHFQWKHKEKEGVYLVSEKAENEAFPQ